MSRLFSRVLQARDDDISRNAPWKGFANADEAGHKLFVEPQDMHDDMVKNAEESEVRGTTDIEFSETCTLGQPSCLWLPIGHTLKTDTFFSHVLHSFHSLH